MRYACPWGRMGYRTQTRYNREGSELVPDVLFGQHERLYMALMICRLKNDGLDPEIYLDEMVRAHLNRGAIGLRQRVSGIRDFCDLVH